MTPTAARLLLVLASAFSGLLAGASADRYLVQVPAWRHLDVMTWAEHSRHADMGNGRFWYPLLAFAATGLGVAVAIAVWQRTLAADGVALPAYLAAAASTSGLAFTFLAAPNLLRLHTPKDRPTTERSFTHFHRWGLPRAVLQIAAFPLNLWALWALVRVG
jgi:hypothetical protein